MTLKQLEYVVKVAECGTVSGAAKALFVAQPSLSAAIQELESEMHLTLFHRTNKGVIVTKEGEVFLSYARQILEQTALLESRYKGDPVRKQAFCVSTQHYSFAVNAFVDLIKEFGGDEYDFSIRETQTHEIIEDVARMKSELGILYLNDFNEPVLSKETKSKELKFTELFSAKPHVFVGSANPLAQKKSVTLDDLLPYPYLSFEQGEYNSFYYSEEILSTIKRPKNIRVRDRATLFNLLIGLNGYTICSGVINEELNGKNIVAVPLAVDDYMEIGYITHSKVGPGKFGTLYIEALKRYASAQE